MAQSSNARIFLIGYIEIPADRLTAVREALPAHIKLTRAEPGCISFEVREDEFRSGRFLVSESFKSQEAFDAHQERARNSDWFTVTEGIPRNYTVTTESAESGQDQ